MNLTITPQNKYNSYYSNKNQKVAFAAKSPNNVIDEAETAIANIANKKSKLFTSLEKRYDKFTDGIANHITSRFIEWSPLQSLANKFKGSENLFQHCLTVGSVVTSGLYMQRTLTNKELDEDRRNTLAVNQGLTLAVSTAGAYILDRYIKNWWDNVTARFAGHLLHDDQFYEKYLKDKTKIIEENKKFKIAGNAEKKPLPKLIKLVENHRYYKNLDATEAKKLITQVKGMGPLRSMIVFGFVYRFFVPVAVTKPANKLCEKYLENKAKNKANA